eukprot:gene26354-26549_t
MVLLFLPQFQEFNQSAPPVNAEATPDAEIRNLIADWAKSWSDGEVDTYLSAYCARFVPAEGLSRKAWEAQRRQRVDKGRGIVVKVKDVNVESTGTGRAK